MKKNQEMTNGTVIYKLGKEVYPGKKVWFFEEKWQVQSWKTGRLSITLPPNAVDGFYILQNAEWKLCEIVRAHATSMTVDGGKAQRADHWFYALRHQGRLVKRWWKESLAANSFFEPWIPSRYRIKGLAKVNNVHVDRGGWFTARERLDWKPTADLTQYRPLSEILKGRYHVVRQHWYGRRQRITVKNAHKSLTLKLARKIRGGKMCPSDPIIWEFEDAQGKVHYHSYWKDSEADPRFLELQKQVRETGFSPGPLEQRHLKVSRGLFYLTLADWGSTGATFNLKCPHGYKVSSMNVAAHEGGLLSHLHNHVKNEFWNVNRTACPCGCGNNSGESLFAQGVWTDYWKNKFDLPEGTVVPISEAIEAVAKFKKTNKNVYGDF